jgi:hypothetical protein
VPSGGSVGGIISAIDGEPIGQIVRGQMGGRSIALLHIGCISPSTQRQTDAARAGIDLSNAAVAGMATNDFGRGLESATTCRPARIRQQAERERDTGT